MKQLEYLAGVFLAAGLLAACNGGASAPAAPMIPARTDNHRVNKMAGNCAQITDSTGAQYTAARTGGGNNIDVEFSSVPCDIGIYISASNGPNQLDHAIVNGAFPIGIYFDNAGSGAHEDHTQICVSGSNLNGTCKTGTGSSPGTGLDIRNTPALAVDHTSIDGYVAGFATNACPNSANHMTVDHTVITNATFPWSYQGGNNNFNFNPGHDSPQQLQGGSCAGSSVGAGSTPSPSPSPSPTASPTSTPSSGPPVLYVTNSGNSTVTAYDEDGNLQTLTGTFPGLYYPGPILYHPNNHFIYVGNGNNSESMTAYDTNGNEQTLPAGSFPNLGDPSGIAYDPDNGFLYVSNYQLSNGSYGGVTVYDQNGNQQMLPGSFPGAFQTTSAAYDPDNGFIYVTNYSTGFGQQALVNAYDRNGNLQTLSGSFSGLSQSGPDGILYNPSNHLLYIAVTNHSAILAFDRNGNQQMLSGSWTGLSFPAEMAYDPHNGLIYVVNSGGGVIGSSVTAYDNNGNQQAISGSFPGLSYSYGITVVPASAGPMYRKHGHLLHRTKTPMAKPH